MDRDGWLFVGPFAAAAAAAFTLRLDVVGAACFACMVVVAMFFRDPERDVPNDPRAVLSPADGKVMSVADEDDSFLGEPGTRVSVFLSPLDVHVNRSPVAGRVVKKEKRAGGHLAAFKEDATRRNAAVVLLLEGETYGRVVVRQIVGVLARRIVCRVEEGDALAAGQRIGLMRFSSRMDVVMPKRCVVRVKEGDRVRAGETVIAEVIGLVGTGL